MHPPHGNQVDMCMDSTDLKYSFLKKLIIELKELIKLIGPLFGLEFYFSKYWYLGLKNTFLHTFFELTN